MTFEELAASLPNGLHDAELLAFRIDYAAATAVLDLSVDLSANADTEASEDSSYRRAQILFSRVQFVIIDPPGPGFEGFGKSTIDAGGGQPREHLISLPPLRECAFLLWVFVTRLNGFIRIAADDAELKWLRSVGPPSRM